MSYDLQHYDDEGRVDEVATDRSFVILVSPSMEYYNSDDSDVKQLYVEVDCQDTVYDRSLWDLQDSERHPPRLPEGLTEWLDGQGLPLAARNDTIRMILDYMTAPEPVDGIFVRIEEIISDDEELEELERELAELSLQEYRLRPADQGAVEALEKVAITRAERETSCAVCLEEFSLGFEATKMPCMHIFHGDCIVKWLENQCFCPLCRFELRPTAED